MEDVERYLSVPTRGRDKTGNGMVETEWWKQNGGIEIKRGMTPRNDSYGGKGNKTRNGSYGGIGDKTRNCIKSI